jgi:hypothetical protein
MCCDPSPRVADHDASAGRLTTLAILLPRPRVSGAVDIAYVVCCLITAFAALTSGSRRRAFWWLVISLGVLSLVLLRLADASVWLDSYFQKALYIFAWYAERRLLQVLAIVIVAVTLFILLRHLSVGSDDVTLRTAIGAFYLLAVLAAVRVSSLHWTDAVLQEQLGTLTLSHVAQLVFLIFISGAALFELARGRRFGLPLPLPNSSRFK